LNGRKGSIFTSSNQPWNFQTFLDQISTYLLYALKDVSSEKFKPIVGFFADLISLALNRRLGQL
jgi:hypothetical protein